MEKWRVGDRQTDRRNVEQLENKLSREPNIFISQWAIKWKSRVEREREANGDLPKESGSSTDSTVYPWLVEKKHQGTFLSSSGPQQHPRCSHFCCWSGIINYYSNYYQLLHHLYCHCIIVYIYWWILSPAPITYSVQSLQKSTSSQTWLCIFGTASNWYLGGSSIGETVYSLSQGNVGTLRNKNLCQKMKCLLQYWKKNSKWNPSNSMIKYSDYHFKIHNPWGQSTD